MRRKSMIVVACVCAFLFFTIDANCMEGGSNEFVYQKDILVHVINALEEEQSNGDTYIQIFEQNYSKVLEMTEYDTTDEMAGFFLASVYLNTCYDEGTYAYDIGSEALNALEELYSGNINRFKKHMETSYGYYNEAINSGNEDENTQSDMTIGQKNALASALSYLEYSAFSYTGLIEQLEYEGYSNEDAVFAVDNCGADWNEQAAKSAENYLRYSSFSKNGLIEQLEYEGFTHEQAVYGAEANGY